MSKAILCGGKPTARDLKEVDAFKAFLLTMQDARDRGMSRDRAVRHAALEVYGDELAEQPLPGERG